jgi:ubiquinone/menaquinone biosynthesis C-methylase UbiE
LWCKTLSNFQADVIEGLEPFARSEIERAGGRPHPAQRGILHFTLNGDARKLLSLKTVLSVYATRTFKVPRPKVLLGDQHLRALLALIDDAMAIAGRNAYRTFMLGAAGADSTVMQRIKAEIARHTQLKEATEEGDLLVRLLPSPNPLPKGEGFLSSPINGEGAGGGGWLALVRISPQPLGTRPWRECVTPGALQATMAHVMAGLTQPKPNDVVLNVCCGSGTLLIERGMLAPAQRLIGCDISKQALDCAARNVTTWRAGGAELYDWDAARLPLEDNSVSALLADLPFGNRVGSHADNRALYPAVLREAARVAKAGARFVVISAEVKLLQATLQAQDAWQVKQTLRVNLGGLQPMIAVMERNSAADRR